MMSKEDYIKEVGVRIRFRRKELNLSMEEISDRLDMEYRQYGRIERGEVNTSIYIISKIAEVLDTTPTQFLVFG